MEEEVSTDYLLQDPYMGLGYETSMESPIIKNDPSTPTFFGDGMSSSSMLDHHHGTTSSNNSGGGGSTMISMSSTPTPLLVSSPPATLYNPHLQDPQTHEHFLNLLSQIKQTHQTLTSYQTNHDFINAQTAAAVAAQQLPGTEQGSSSSSSPTQSSIELNLQQLHHQQQLQLQQLQLQQQQLMNQGKTTETECSLTISMPTKKNIKASAIASPPNSPRKNVRNNKVKSKTQQVQQQIQSQIQQQQHQQQQHQQQQQSSSVPSLRLSGSPPPSSPPQQPLTPPPLPPTTTTSTIGKAKVTRQSTKKTAPPTGPNVISIISQLGHPIVNNTPQQSPALTSINTKPTEGSNQTGNEDKKHVCQSFLKYYLRVNPSLSTPNLRRSLILSLYVNKISQDLRYRRPNDMANLCVVLYGYLFSSLDEATIKEFINNHSSSQRSKRDDKKKKRKREKEESDQKFSPNLEKSLKSSTRGTIHNSNNNIINNNNNNNNTIESINGSNGNGSGNGELWAPIQTTPSYFYDSLNVASPDSNGVLSPHNSNVTNNNNNGSTFMHSPNLQQQMDSPQDQVHSVQENGGDDDGDERELTLHEAFINCVKSCNLLPFIEFRPVYELQPPTDLTLTGDHYYSFDDLIRWENEIKDLKLSVKSQQTQQKLQQLQQSQQQTPNQINTSQSNLSIYQHQQLNQIQQQQQIGSPLQQQHQQQQQLNQIQQQTSPNSNFQQQQQISMASFQQGLQIQPQQVMVQQNMLLPMNSYEDQWKSNDYNMSLGSPIMVNVHENDESYIIYVAIPHSRPNSLRVTVNQMEVIVEGNVVLPETVYLANGTEMAIPHSFPSVGQNKQEFAVGPFTKHIPLSSPVSSSVVGKKEGIVVIIARKETSMNSLC